MERIEAERIKAEQDATASKDSKNDEITPDSDSDGNDNKDTKEELKELIDNKAD